MTLKLACADFSFPLTTHDVAMRLIAMLGFQGLDMGVFSGRSHLQPEEVMRDIPGTARTYRQKLDDSGLELADVYLQPAADFEQLAPNQPDAQRRARAREIFLRILEFAARCNARHMSDLPGIHFTQETYEDSFARCAEELAWRVQQARNVGIVYSVEPHLGSIVSTPPLARRLVEQTPGLTLTLDYGHFTYQGIPDSEIEPLLPMASHFHARAGCKDRLQTPLKENAIDYSRIVELMKQQGYAGYVGVEYVWIDWQRCNECDNISETILLRDLLLRSHAGQ